jgi:Putative beta-barrel porin-2, OmpL-like. bbp2
MPGDNKTQASLTNGQVFIQNADGVFQFYLQAGAYNLPALATPFLETDKTISNFYGPVPVGFVKLQAGKNTSFLVGSLPTLIGAEYTFTFENRISRAGCCGTRKTRSIVEPRSIRQWARSRPR